MALYPCPECKREISTDAKDCPHCGKRAGWAAIQARWKAMPAGVQYFLVGAVAFFLVVMLLSNAPDKGKLQAIPAPVAQASTAAPAADGRMTVRPGTWFGFHNRELLERAMQIASQGDKAAWSKLMAKAVVAGAVIQLKPGEEVFLEDTAVFSGMVKIRRKGDISGLWTNMEAVR
ncbi:MAG: hypothetical protein RDU24_13705 [Humidesulfovibrio sp.]|uniref:hypothetical protein n=1 Tax=Humidesulfovibrio sp. TaxID=2910988 RepID=UPI0027FE5514|nr:hypothetical protein [Humidesulfovibrio sp.]MDQ7836431.1 hypothetical protein [Humidesulfovibrio sp.]